MGFGWLRSVLTCAILVGGGCGIDRAGVGEIDGGAGSSDGGIRADAPAPDAGPDPDGGGTDSGPVPDGGTADPDGGAGDPDSGIPTTAYIHVTAGGLHGCRLSAAGALECWGTNTAGQLGTGDEVSEDHPVPVAIGAAVVSVDAGGEHTCAVVADGRLYCWGLNDDGQLGLGTTTSESTPAVVGTDRWRSVSAGEKHTCAIRSDATLWCWGAFEDGRLGIGMVKEAQRAPVQVAAGSRFMAVSAGQDFTCAIEDDGELFCWGRNDKGQAGVNQMDRDTPLRIDEADDWVGVAAGGDHACGVHAGGTLHCWGRNHKGQLGASGMDGPALRQPRGVWASVSAGTNHSCAIDAAGALLCWGEGTPGRLGTGGAADETMPTPVIGSFGAWLMVSASRLQTCAILVDDGRVYCFGENMMLQLGLGDTTDRDVPTAQ